MHTPYEIILKHKADFRVIYRFYTEEEGGRKSLPFQGYRSDFWYDNPKGPNNIFMIWPEFEDENGNVIIETNHKISEAGKAGMWIIVPQAREYHKDKIKVGVKGFFMEGSRRVAECKVVEIIDLLSNPAE